MQLTRAGEYAIKSLVYLATQDPTQRVMASEVATEEAIPVNFVRKILESLAKVGLVKSFRGAGGGFSLARSPEEITMRQVIEAIEGPIALNHCLAPNPCDQLCACAMSQIWMEAQRAVEDVLGRYSLADIARTRDLRRHAGIPAATA
ncbi:MAG: RrF2 family transcriptional regulator [Armatimonadota bacterium]